MALIGGSPGLVQHEGKEEDPGATPQPQPDSTHADTEIDEDENRQQLDG